MNWEPTGKFLEIVGAANEIRGVADGLSDTQRVFMSGDIVLLDTKTKDYNGRACLIKYPGDDKARFNRVFIDGDTVTAVCATDGDINFTGKLDEVEISGAVVGIVRKLEPEERQDASKWDEFCKVALPEGDKLRNYYPIDWGYFSSVRQHERGGASGMFFYGYYYGFERGRKAQKAESRRIRRAERKKEAAKNG